MPRAGQSPAAATAPMPRSTAPATPAVIDVQLRSSLAGLRALGRAGLKPIAMAPTAGAAGMWSRHAHGRSVSADPAADRAGFAAGLAEKADAQGTLVAYPGREEAIDGLLDASKLSPSVVLPFPPAAFRSCARRPTWRGSRTRAS